MHGAFPQPDGGGRLGRLSGNVRLHVGRQTRRRYVQRLLEERTVQRIGLIEHGEHNQLAANQEPLQRHLRARNERFHQDVTRHPAAPLYNVRGAQDRREAFKGGDELVCVIGPHDAAAGRQVERLQHARKGHALGRPDRIIGNRQALESRRRKPGRGYLAAQAVLVARRRHRRHRIVRQPQRPGGRRGQQRTVVVNRHNGVQWVRAGKRRNRPHRLARPEKVQLQVAAGKQRRKGLPALRAHRHVQPQAACRFHEVVRPIGAGRQQEQHAGHANTSSWGGRTPGGLEMP